MPLYGTLSLFRTSFAGCDAFPCVSLGCDVSTCKPYRVEFFVAEIGLLCLTFRIAVRLRLISDEAARRNVRHKRPHFEPFCRGRLLRVDQDAKLLSLLRVVLGDSESLDSMLCTLTPDPARNLTSQEKTGAMSFSR